MNTTRILTVMVLVLGSVTITDLEVPRSYHSEYGARTDSYLTVKYSSRGTIIFVAEFTRVPGEYSGLEGVTIVTVSVVGSSRNADLLE